MRSNDTSNERQLTKEWRILLMRSGVRKMKEGDHELWVVVMMRVEGEVKQVVEGRKRRVAR